MQYDSTQSLIQEIKVLLILLWFYYYTAVHAPGQEREGKRRTTPTAVPCYSAAPPVCGPTVEAVLYSTVGSVTTNRATSSGIY